MIDKGIAHIGIGKAKGDDKAIEAVKQAVSSPLLETTIAGASHVIINISGDIGLMEANEAATYVQELAGEDANIIFGAMYDETVQDEATITVIATGLEPAYEENIRPARVQAASTYHPTATAAPVRPHVRVEETPAPVFEAQEEEESAKPVTPTPAASFVPRQPVHVPEASVRQKTINIPDFLKR